MNYLDKNIHATIISNWEKDQNASALKPNFYSIHGCAIHFPGIVKYTKTNINWWRRQTYSVPWQAITQWAIIAWVNLYFACLKSRVT